MLPGQFNELGHYLGEHGFLIIEMDHKAGSKIAHKVRIPYDSKYFTQQRVSIAAFLMDRSYGGQTKRNNTKDWEGVHFSQLAHHADHHPDDEEWFIVGAGCIPKTSNMIVHNSVWEFYKFIGYDHKKDKFTA